MSSKKWFFGSPPFRYLATHLVTQDDEFKDDAQFILAIDEAAFQRVASQLAECDGFLDRDKIEALATPILGEEDSESLTDFLVRISNTVHSAEIDLSDAMTQFGEIICEKFEHASEADRSKLVQRIRSLIIDPAGLAKQYKARQLAEAIGCELDRFRIICDIRPIFDPNRARIEGAIPVTVMRLEYDTPDGDSSVVEVRITEKQLTDLANKVSEAQRKIDVIRQFMSGHNLPIPNTKATISGN